MNDKTVSAQQIEVGCKYYVFMKECHTRIDAFVYNVSDNDVVFECGNVYRQGKITPIGDYCSVEKEKIEKAVLIDVY